MEKNRSASEQARSQAVKDYWKTPEGQKRKAEQRERMFGNKNAKKNKPGEYIPPGPEGESTSPPGQGYTGTEPGHEKKPGQRTEDPPPAAPKQISPEVFRRAWPKFLKRVHKAFSRIFGIVEWGANKLLVKWFPTVKIHITLDDYTPAEAELDTELTELLLEDTLPAWISKHKIRAFFIAAGAWLIGGINFKVEKREEKDGRASEKIGGSTPRASTEDPSGGD